MAGRQAGHDLLPLPTALFDLVLDASARASCFLSISRQPSVGVRLLDLYVKRIHSSKRKRDAKYDANLGQ
jgi:hypothetical protein